MAIVTDCVALGMLPRQRERRRGAHARPAAILVRSQVVFAGAAACTLAVVVAAALPSGPDDDTGTLPGPQPVPARIPAGSVGGPRPVDVPKVRVVPPPTAGSGAHAFAPALAPTSPFTPARASAPAGVHAAFAPSTRVAPTARTSLSTVTGGSLGPVATSPPTGPSPLAGLSRTVIDRPVRVNLSGLRASDWVRWGTGADPAQVEPAWQGSGLPTLFPNLGDGPLRISGAGLVRYEWNDGAVSGAHAGTTGGLAVSGPGRGFRLAVPTPAKPSTLLLYVGSRGGARLSVTADGVQVLADELPGRPDRLRGAIYRLHLVPGAQPSPILVSWASTGADPSADVTIEAAALLPG